jgi:hypothetical protein
MCAAPVSPVPIVSTGGLATATLLWQWRDRVHVTARVKASFAMRHDAAMELTLPDPIDPLLELAPYRAEVDVMIVAAHAHTSVPAEAAAVRLVLIGAEVLVDKGLLVYAPRPGGVVAPFQHATIVTRSGRPDALVVNPADPRERGTLGPREGAAARAHLSGGALLVAEDVDWSAFQRAPRDQRVVEVKGDEWVVLEGMTPHRGRLRARLPGAYIETRVYGPSLWCGRSQRLVMHPDQLLIDADQEVCSIGWRGSFTVQSAAVARSLTLVSALHMPGHRASWPTASQVATSAALQVQRAHLAGVAVTSPVDRRAVTPPEHELALAAMGAQGATVPDAEEASQLSVFGGVVLVDRVDTRSVAITETGTLDLPPDKNELAPPDAYPIDLAPAEGAPWSHLTETHRAPGGTLIGTYDEPPELPGRGVDALEATLSDTLDGLGDSADLPIKG